MFMKEYGKMRILVMGLPGSGKTFLSKALKKKLHENNRNCVLYNADEVREKYKDWDFSIEGRIRQANRMKELSHTQFADYVVCDFVCPLESSRNEFNADFLVWINTLDEGRFEDTNKVFEKPKYYDIEVTTKDCEKWATEIVNLLLTKEI